MLEVFAEGQSSPGKHWQLREDRALVPLVHSVPSHSNEGTKPEKERGREAGSLASPTKDGPWWWEQEQLQRRLCLCPEPRKL